MINEIFAGLIVLSVSGITFIAYKHPTVYEKIYGYLMVLAFVIFFGFCIWDIAIQTTDPIITNFVQPDKQNIARNALNELRVNGTYVMPILCGVELYLFLISFLKFLPKSE